MKENTLGRIRIINALERRFRQKNNEITISQRLLPNAKLYRQVLTDFVIHGMDVPENICQRVYHERYIKFVRQCRDSAVSGCHLAHKGGCGIKDEHEILQCFIKEECGAIIIGQRLRVAHDRFRIKRMAGGGLTIGWTANNDCL